jgi:hypothetical protein
MSGRVQVPGASDGVGMAWTAVATATGLGGGDGDTVTGAGELQLAATKTTSAVRRRIYRPWVWVKRSRIRM